METKMVLILVFAGLLLSAGLGSCVEIDAKDARKKSIECLQTTGKETFCKDLAHLQ